MSVPVPVIVLGVVLRELVRMVVAPLHFLAFLPGRRRWARRAEAALAARPDQEHDAAPLLRIPRTPGTPHVFVSAGEASGEMHAERLVHAARGAGLEARWSCFGGTRLAGAGARLLWPLSEHAVMGLRAVFASLPFFVRAVARFVRLLREDRPDLVVLVDYPGLHLVLAELCARYRVPALHYIAPQYWAWGPWRMRRYAKAFAGTLTILPFEPAWFAAFAIPSRYVGHPLLDAIAEHPTPPPPPAAPPLLVLLPGSRTKDITTHLPGMLGVAAALASEQPGLRVVVPQREERKARLVRELVGSRPSVEVHHGELADAIAGARLVVAKSGTGSLEAVLRGVPTVVVYRVGSRLSAALYTRLVMLPYFASANLIANEPVVPEVGFGADDGWPRVVDAARRLWPEGTERQRCLAGLARVRDRLGGPGGSARAAAHVAAAFSGTPSSGSGSSGSGSSGSGFSGSGAAATALPERGR